MKRLIKYFQELLITLKSIDERLKTLEDCTRDDYKTSPSPYKKIIKVGSGYNP